MKLYYLLLIIHRYDDRYSVNRPDDRYDPNNIRQSSYDRYYPSQYYNTQQPLQQTSQYDNVRGNGYDNRDPIYYDRGTMGATNRGGYYSGYDRGDYYNRDRDTGYQVNSRGYYDYKNYRPWDETYRY